MSSRLSHRRSFLKILLTLLLFTSLLPALAFAVDPAPACVDEKIAIQDLTQKLMQAQYLLLPQQFEVAKKEQQRLEALRPKPETKPTEPSTETPETPAEKSVK